MAINVLVLKKIEDMTDSFKNTQYTQIRNMMCLYAIQTSGCEKSLLFK